MVGRPWERLEKLKLRELASETKEYSGDNLKMEHLKELSDIMDDERGKLQWLLEDDVEVDEGWLEQESTSNVPPPKRSRTEAETIRFFIERLSSIQLSAKDWRLSKIMKQSGLLFTEKQMLTIVAGLGERGQWKHAMSLVEWVYNTKEHKHHKSRFVYTKLLAILGKARRAQEALKLFNFMREDRHIYPDMAAYHSIAVALGQAGLLKELLNIIQLMKEKPKKVKNMRYKNWNPELQPDIVVYNAVLNACVPSQQWKGVSWVFEQLRKDGLRPNGPTYGLAMEVMLHSGKYDLVHEFFRKMKRSGQALKALTYKVLVKSFWKEGKVDEALEAVRDMERRGIIAMSCVYHELAWCLCFHGRCQEAILEVEKLKDIQFNRSLEVCFTGMILAAFNGGHLCDCFTIYEHCKKSCKPDIGIVNAVLQVYGRSDMFMEAKELFEEIKRKSPGSGNHLKDSGSSLLNPSAHTFSLMLQASASAEQWEYFEYVYREMILFGHQFNQRKHPYLLVEASRHGKGHLLEHAFDTILEAGEVPSPLFFTEILFLAVVQNDYDKVTVIVNSMIHTSFRVSKRQWSEVLAAYSDRITKDSLNQLLEVISSHDLTRRSSIHNLYRTLQYMIGGGVCSLSDLISTVPGNEMVGTSNISNPPANIASYDPLRSIQVKGRSGSTYISSYSEDDSDLKNGDESPNQCSAVEHNGYQDFASMNLRNNRSSVFVEEEEEEEEYMDSDVSDVVELEISAIGHGDFDEPTNVPSAKEILKIWKHSFNSQ